VLRPLLTGLGLLLFMLLPVVPASALELSRPAAPAQDPPKAHETGIGIRLLDIPAATQTDPRARSYIVDHLKPGATIERRVQLTNGTSSSQPVQIYPGAAHIQDDAFFGENGAAVNDLTTWISTDRQQLNLEPGETTETLVTITVPKDAPEDEQYAIIWAEIRSAADPDTKIATANRVGVRVYLSVGPGNGPPADFSIDDLSPGRNQNGDPEISTTVTNTGGRALDITGSLKLADGPGGLSTGPKPLDQGTTIAPGESSAVRATLPSELPNGPWEATLDLKSGLVSHEARATVVFPDANQEPVAVPDEGPNVALIAGGIALVVIVIGAILWWVRRRNRVAS
jgi:hypothetical protein